MRSAKYEGGFLHVSVFALIFTVCIDGMGQLRRSQSDRQTGHWREHPIRKFVLRTLPIFFLHWFFANTRAKVSDAIHDFMVGAV